MQYTEQQKAAFKEEFRVRRKRQIVLAIALVAPAAVFAIFADGKKGEETLLGLSPALVAPVFLLLVLGAIVFSFRNWRCPACDRYLGKGGNPRFCPKCGAPLQ
jgi:rubrerythrin